MNSTLKLIDDELTQIVAAIQAIGSNEPLNVAHNAWNNPGTTREELLQIVAQLQSQIAAHGEDQLTSNEELLSDYTRRLAYVRANTLPHIWSSNAGQAVSAFLITIQGLHEALEKALPEPENLVAAIALERSNAKSAATRLRALEAQIVGLEPRAKTGVDPI